MPIEPLTALPQALRCPAARGGPAPADETIRQRLAPFGIPFRGLDAPFPLADSVAARVPGAGDRGSHGSPCALLLPPGLAAGGKSQAPDCGSRGPLGRRVRPAGGAGAELFDRPAHRAVLQRRPAARRPGRLSPAAPARHAGTRQLARCLPRGAFGAHRVHERQALRDRSRPAARRPCARAHPHHAAPHGDRSREGGRQRRTGHRRADSRHPRRAPGVRARCADRGIALAGARGTDERTARRYAAAHGPQRAGGRAPPGARPHRAPPARGRRRRRVA